MKNIFFITGVIVAIVFSFSCNNSSAEPNLDKENNKNFYSSKTNKTQALLLTQPFDFDPLDKNKVSGKYINNSKLTVPLNLTTQSKWIMFEGPVLENDLVAYRYYADSRHRFDIYGKTVSNLVMDTVGWNYHDITNWGTDILKVGNSLGLGTPAVWFRDTLYTLSDCEEKTIEVLENGKSSSVIRTTFKQLNIAGQTFDLIQDWSIAEGESWSEIHLKITNGALPQGMYFASGIVKHLPEIIQGETSNYFYAMNWGIQSFHKENMGMAVLVEKKYQPEHIVDDLSHAYAFKNANQEVRYRFLSAWERDNNKVKDANGFKQLVKNSAK